MCVDFFRERMDDTKTGDQRLKFVKSDRLVLSFKSRSGQFLNF